MLDDPLRSRVSGHVEVQNLPPSVLDDEEAVQHLEGQRRHGEEVEGSDHLAVILEKGQPTLAWITAAPDTLQISGYGSFGDDEAELLEFSMDLGRPPVGFSSARRRISARISSVIFGRPRACRDRQRQ